MVEDGMVFPQSLKNYLETSGNEPCEINNYPKKQCPSREYNDPKVDSTRRRFTPFYDAGSIRRDTRLYRRPMTSKDRKKFSKIEKKISESTRDLIKGKGTKGKKNPFGKK